MEPLVEQAGGVAIQWYHHWNPYIEHENRTMERNKALVSNFTVPTDDVVTHLMFALGKWKASRRDIAKLKGKKLIETRR